MLNILYIYILKNVYIYILYIFCSYQRSKIIMEALQVKKNLRPGHAIDSTVTLKKGSVPVRAELERYERPSLVSEFMSGVQLHFRCPKRMGTQTLVRRLSQELTRVNISQLMSPKSFDCLPRAFLIVVFGHRLAKLTHARKSCRIALSQASLSSMDCRDLRSTRPPPPPPSSSSSSSSSPSS